MQEIFKMFMNEISLKTLDFYFNSTLDFYSDPTLDFYSSSNFIQNIPFTTYPGAIDCLNNLSELTCDSDISSEFFYLLSQTCHNIQSLSIFLVVERGISNGLPDFISIQKDLKYLRICNDHNCEDLMEIISTYLRMRNDYNCENLTETISTLTKLPNTLIEVNINGGGLYIPFSFIAKFTNLQVLVLYFYYGDEHEDEYFKNLQYITLPQLQILKFPYRCTNHEHLIKFLENNGKNLIELHISYGSKNSLNLAIAKFCSNLKSLGTEFKDNEVETLKVILNICQQLESIEVRFGRYHLVNSDIKILEVVTNCSIKKSYELIIPHIGSGLFAKKLEPILTSWSNRIPQKSLSLIINNSRPLKVKKAIMEVIEKFKKLGVIKKFEINKFEIVN